MKRVTKGDVYFTCDKFGDPERLRIVAKGTTIELLRWEAWEESDTRKPEVVGPAELLIPPGMFELKSPDGTQLNYAWTGLLLYNEETDLAVHRDTFAQ